jgi:outer membrane protein assembly factor BamB
MARVSAPRCSNCHAPLQLAPDAREVTCRYCGLRAEVQRDPPPAQPSPGPLPVQAAASVSKAVIILPLVAVLLSAGLGLVGFLVMGSGASGGGTVTRIGATFSARTPATPEVIIWHQGVALCSIDGDGLEDVVGAFRRNEDETQKMYVGAFRGADLKRAWEVGPFGTSDDPTQYTRFACADDTVAVADFRGTIRAYELSSGAERWSFSVTDRVDRMCADRASRKLFVEVADGAHKLVDLGVGRAEDAEHPDFCPPLQSRRIRECGMLSQFRDGYNRAECERISRERNGIYADYALTDGDTRVLIGYKQPGTRIPMAAGVVNDEIAWTRELPSGDLARAKEGSPDLFDLVDGRLIVVYESGTSWRVTALDAASGQRLWDTVISEDGRGITPRTMTITGCRIYLAGWWLGVLDVDSGAIIGSVGWHGPGPTADDVPACTLAR